MKAKLYKVEILFFLICSAISTDIGLAVLHYQSQHSFSLCLSEKKRKKKEFSNFCFFSLIYHPSNFFFSTQGFKIFMEALDRHLRVHNRHLIALFRSPSLTVNFIEVCACLWTPCSQFQTSSLMDC